MMPQKIGLAAMSAKPFHRGHDALIRSAARECDLVRVFVSLTDRKRPGEIPVLGSDMALIWQDLIEPELPVNTTVEYGGEPVGKVWAALGEAERSNSRDTFVIYGDETDLAARFKPAALKKYAETIYADDRIVLRTTPRITSATAVRRAIGASDFAIFEAEMPEWLDAKKAWSILAKKNTNESLIRSYVRAVFKTLA